jgi:hypothetical protein
MIGRDRFTIISSLEQMCYAGKAATAYYYITCEARPDVVRGSPFRIRDIRECNRDLEGTYLVRMFAEFERQLRDCWERHFNRSTRPMMEVLVDRLASRCHMQYGVLSNVHSVREYRNSLVHGGAAAPLTLAESRSYLCRFLADLPRTWQLQ